MQNPRKITIPVEIWLPSVYLTLGTLWILFSDKILLNISNGDIDYFARLQTLKGWTYVGVTTVLLFVLLWAYNKRRSRYIRIIESARLNAENANKLKSTFLANLSHELRTPMNAINGFSELIKQYVANPEVSNQYHSIIKENSLKLLKIIESIVDMSKIQVNLLKIKPTTFTVDELCTTLKFNTETFVPENRILHFIKQSKDFQTLTTDFGRLLQICEILVINSISNPGKGTLVLSCKVVEDKFAVDIHWEKSMKETEIQLAAGNTDSILNQSIGWDIANGLAKLLKGTVSAHQFSDNTHRFLLIIPKTLK